MCGGRKLLGLAAVYVVYFFLLDAPLWRGPGPYNDHTSPRYGQTCPATFFGNRVIVYEDNLNIGEAVGWWRGTFELPFRRLDTALFEGRILNAYPPMMTLIAAAVIPFCAEGVPQVLLAALLGLPLPGLAYWLMLKRTRRVWMAVVLAIALVCGTSVFPVLRWALRSSQVYHVNHVLAVAGQLVMLAEFFGRRRVGVMGLGLMLAAWSRQLTAFYAIPLIWAAWRGSEDSVGTMARGSSRGARMAQAAAVCAVVAGVPAVLNTLKFHRPWDFGYRHLYEGIESEQARCAKIGIFSPAFIARNAYVLNLGLPKLKREYYGWRLVTNFQGTGIWWTSPLLLYLLPAFRKIVMDAASRVWLAAAALVVLGILMYHTTGKFHQGHHRFSTDFIPVLFALLAPRWNAARRPWLVCVFALCGIGWFVSLP
ncbi:MAG: hypothetical protein FLDDKLPJ_01605 [Phycisphaerae bacterium]|nr:hypothetical protein [Phycisphaerae bacterium]